jgi:hypothetical protein
LKTTARRREPVEMRGLGLRVAAEGTDPVVQIVDDEEQHVGLGSGRRGRVG